MSSTINISFSRIDRTMYQCHVYNISGKYIYFIWNNQILLRNGVWKHGIFFNCFGTLYVYLSLANDESWWYNCYSGFVFFPMDSVWNRYNCTSSVFCGFSNHIWHGIKIRLETPYIQERNLSLVLLSFIDINVYW